MPSSQRRRGSPRAAAAYRQAIEIAREQDARLLELRPGEPRHIHLMEEGLLFEQMRGEAVPQRV